MMLKKNPAIKKSMKESNTILMKKKNKIQFVHVEEEEVGEDRKKRET